MMQTLNHWQATRATPGKPRYPFVSLDTALVLLRVCTAMLYMAHAAVRIVNGSIPQFGGFMERLGFRHGELWVWAITAVELIGGTLMALGRQVAWSASALFTIAAGGIVLIHRHFGWFVGEHGTGGSEYSVALMMALLVIAAADARRRRERAPSATFSGTNPTPS
jgi:putative oxidoreductase